MIPTISGPHLAMLREAVVRFTYLVQIDLEDETLYVCTADRDIEYGGNTYIGVGRVSSIEPITEKASIEVTGLRLSLSGVPLAMRSLALQEDIRGRECRIYVGLFDEDEAAVLVLKEFSGTMSAPAITTSAMGESGERTATISIAVESAFTTWAKGGRARRHTHADQTFHYPGDLGYEFADKVATEVHLYPWGKPN